MPLLKVRSFFRPISQAVLASLLLVTPCFATLPGQPAPAIQTPALGDLPAVPWADLRGKVVMVDFWALWCAPCRTSLPHLEKLRRKYGSDALAVVGVNLDDDALQVQNFLKQNPIGFPTLQDPGGQLARDYGVRRLPTTYLIDKNGIIRWIIEGTDGKDDKNLREALEDMFQSH